MVLRVRVSNVVRGGAAERAERVGKAVVSCELWLHLFKHDQCTMQLFFIRL